VLHSGENNIRLAPKIPDSNTSAYFGQRVSDKEKQFIILTPCWQPILDQWPGSCRRQIIALKV
jgi:hypothetical protein